MLTEQEMKAIAEHYLTFLERNSSTDIELALYDNSIKKDYGNIYIYQNKRYMVTGDEQCLLGGNAPFLVEKETGRVVSFGTAYPKEHYFEAYENGTLEPTLTGYWYPEDERYSHE
ncbi:hypothetical protein [Olleya sp. R77988]|uniref:hypothetical protein n=1 Tax=Olleya sp. R77988 TaxID=3093875 RepID=UPI0037C70324